MNASIDPTTTIDRWRADPVAFIETVLFDPETGKPFVLLDAEKQFLARAFQTDDAGRLRYPEQVYACPKKSGKTAFAALHMLTTVLLFGERFAEGYALANDLEQATSRVFQAIKRIVEASPLLQREAKVTADKITFPAFFTLPSAPSPATTPALPGLIRRSRASTNCGHTPANAAAVCLTRWCRRRPARSRVA